MTYLFQVTLGEGTYKAYRETSGQLRFQMQENGRQCVDVRMDAGAMDILGKLLVNAAHT